MPLPDNFNTYDEITESNSTENTIILILTSVSDMGISLSKLIETEASEIQLLATAENDRNLSVSDIILFNKSVQRILKKICMLQMLLQIKLEYINKFIHIYTNAIDATDIGSNITGPCNNDVKADSITAIRDMAEKAKKELGELRSPNTINASKHCLMGRGHGQILRPEDSFYNGIAIVQVYNNENCSTDNFLCYTAMKGTRMMNFKAYPNSLITELEVNSDCKKIKIEGIGSIVMKERFKPDKRDMGSFELTICIDENGKEKNFFQMLVMPTKNSDFNQMSGKIEAECSNLQINAVN